MDFTEWEAGKNKRDALDWEALHAGMFDYDEYLAREHFCVACGSKLTIDNSHNLFSIAVIQNPETRFYPDARAHQEAIAKERVAKEQS